MDINSDLGESYGAWRMGDDAAMLDIVTSANVACGFHAGDPAGILDTLKAAAERGVAVGAHVAHVAGAEPAVGGERIGRGLRVAVVALEEAGARDAEHLQVTRLAVGAGRTVVADEA